VQKESREGGWRKDEWQVGGDISRLSSLEKIENEKKN